VACAEVVVFNKAERAIPSAGPNAVVIGHRWVTPDGRMLEREQLGLNELAALPQSMPRAVPRRRSVRAEVALYAPNEPGTYRLEVSAIQHGRGSLEDFGLAPALGRAVEVVLAS
jgi:hypothetical protein